jgi:hypothetical protein
MREIERIVKLPKQNYFIDIFLIYLYMNLSLQINVAIRYMHFYLRSNSLLSQMNLDYPQTLSA